MNNHSLLELLLRNLEYNIIGHIRPDGDCIGSQLAIYHILQQYNIRCNIIKNDDCGNVLSGFLDGCSVIPDDHANYKLPLICVDCSDFFRTGKIIPNHYERPYLNIDHHISNNNYGEYRIYRGYRCYFYFGFFRRFWFFIIIFLRNNYKFVNNNC